MPGESPPEVMTAIFCLGSLAMVVVLRDVVVVVESGRMEVKGTWFSWRARGVNRWDDRSRGGATLYKNNS